MVDATAVSKKIENPLTDLLQAPSDIRDLTLDGDRPNVSYSEVTITQWEPEERKY